MCKRIILFYLFLFTLNSWSACTLPRGNRLMLSGAKSAGMNYLDQKKFATVADAIAAAAAETPPIVFSEEDLCYGFAPKWGNDRYIEAGTRMGWCQIELFGDLTYKGYRAIKKEPEPPAVNPSINATFVRDVYDRNVGVDWPMMDCSKLPPECDTGFTAMRFSNFMLNSTNSGIINGDKTTIVQNWTCVKI